MGCPITLMDVPNPQHMINSVLDVVNLQREDAKDLVDDTLNAIGNFQDALRTLETLDKPLVYAAQEVIPPDLSTPGAISVSINRYVAPPAPEAPAPGGTTMPEVPDAPSLELTEPGIDLDIDKPSVLAAVVPSEPGLPDVTVPDAPVVTMPTLPSFSGVNIPAIPTIDLPVFAATLSDLPDAPDPSFEWNEVEFSSDLLDSLQYWLAVWVAGDATGLDPDVERALWDRGRDREAATYGQAATQVLDTMAGRGFPMPPGAAAVMIADAGMKMRGQVSTYNRDVAIKQAELEQQNRQFAFAKAWDIQQGLINYASQRAQRSLEAAKYAVEATIEVYKTMVLRYNAQVEAFKARAEVFKAQLQGELAKLEVFRSQIEAARLTVELDKAQVDLYRAQIEGVRAQIAVYEGQVNAARVQAEVVRAVIDAYKGRVDAYKAQVDAKEAEYKAYETEVRAEVSKIDIVKARADVLNARANAYAATIKGKTDLSNLMVEINERVPLERYRALVNAFQAEVQGEASRVASEVSTNETRVRAYSAEQQARTGMAGVTASLYDSEVRQNLGLTQSSVEAVRTQAEFLMRKASEYIEGFRAVAQLYSTITAGAMAGVNVHAGANGSASSSANLSNSTSQSSMCTTSGD